MSWCYPYVEAGCAFSDKMGEIVLLNLLFKHRPSSKPLMQQELCLQMEPHRAIPVL